MKDHSQTILYLEWMQPDWLLGQRHRQLVTFTTSVMSGLLFLLLSGLSGVLVNGLFAGPLSEVPAELLRIQPAGQPLELPGEQSAVLPSWLGWGLGTGLLDGLSVGIRNPLVGGLLYGLLHWGSTSGWSRDYSMGCLVDSV